MTTKREWAIEYQTFLDGEFDRRIYNDSSTGHPLTFEGAKRILAVEEENRKRRLNSIDYRIVYRDVPDWQVFEDDADSSVR